jgi:uncharacterized repeat protein (TIGR01451 family)
MANPDFEADAIGASPAGWTVTKYLFRGANDPSGANATASNPPRLVSDLDLTTGTSTFQSSTINSFLATEVVGGTNMSLADTDAPQLQFPLFGERSLRINKTSSVVGDRKNANAVVQTFNVTSADVDPADGLVHVRMAMAPVLENPNHGYHEQPFHFVQVENVTNGTILYANNNAAGDPGVPWIRVNPGTNNEVNYTLWQLLDWTGTTDEVAVGDQVKVTIIGGGCSLGGHWGRVYADAESGDFPIAYVGATGLDFAAPGANLPYTVTYRNNSGATVNNAVVTIVTPPNTTFVSTTATGCTTPAVGSGGTITCPLGTLAAGARANFNLTLKTASSFSGRVTFGNYILTATGAKSAYGMKVITEVGTQRTVNVSKVNPANGTVSTFPSIASCGLTCTSASGSVTSGTIMTFTARPKAGETFIGWSGGACSGTATSCTTTVNANTNVIATFSSLALTGTATTLTYDAGSAATVVDSAVAVTGTTPTVTSATVAITTGIVPAEDVLAVTNGSGITGSYNASTGVLTLTGSATPAQYQAVLRTVTYRNTVSPLPTTAPRAVTFALNGLTTARPVQVRAQPSVAVTAPASSGPLASSVTFTATLTPLASTGTVQFTVDGSNVGSPVTLASGAATLTTTTLTVGPHVIGAVYSGDTERLTATASTTSNGAFAYTVNKYPNGTGPCTSGNATNNCVSGLCNTTTSTCGGALNTSCTNANECAGNVCEGGKCGTSNGNPVGPGACTSVNAATVCQSGACSVNGSNCIPAVNGCYVDADCAAAKHCNRNTLSCEDDKANGVAIPNDGIRNGTCAGAGSTAACLSGQCNTTTNTCAGPNTTTSCTAANECVTNFCDATNNKCGRANGNGPCTTGNATTVCQSGACSATSGTCIPSGGCSVDADCPAAQHCNRNALTCVADLANGVAIPNDGLHNGACNAANASATCLSGQCNATTNTCAGPNTTTSCTAANQCVTNVCGSNGSCGTTTGGGTSPGGCTSGTASTVCQSSTCSVNGANCIPASNGCYVDADCAAAKHCNRNTLTCVDDKANGVAIPNDGLHDGTCTTANAAATCTSGQCNAVTNTCAGPNTTTSCTNANQCVTNVCDASNGKCGRTDGTGPCFGAASSCQSGVCNATADGSTSACVPTGPSRCWVDADCPVSDYCARSVLTCRPKETNGTPLPADTLHHACATGNVNAACASGRCNPTTNTCGGPNVTTNCAAANQCITNVCGTNGKCGRTEGEAGCTAATAAAVCQSSTCSTNSGTCIVAGTCWADSDCAANQHCNRNTGACTADKANGEAIPNDGIRNGTCGGPGVAEGCESGECNAATNTCGGPNVTTSCTNANQCVKNACGSNDKCGLANGQLAPGANGCAGTNSGVCQSNTCSVNGTHCIPEPQLSGCYVDGDCPSAKHCNRNTLTCVDDKANGVAIPNDGLHTGVCNDANALATCQSGKCNAQTNTCAGPNTTTTCANANECVTNVCGSNGKCGYADGQAGCTTATAATCQSNVCTASGVCLPAGKCWVDSDCPATDYCARNANTCRPKEPSGTPIPNDGLHDGACTEANAQATCASGKCNAEAKTCGEVNSSTCAQASQCTSNVCFSDGACGVPSNGSCTENAQCRSGACADGFCTTPGAEVRGNGGVSCAVSTASAPANEPASPAWLLGLAISVAVTRRRKGRDTTTTTTR